MKRIAKKKNGMKNDSKMAYPPLSGDSELKCVGERFIGSVCRINNMGTLSYGALLQDMREFVSGFDK